MDPTLTGVFATMSEGQLDIYNKPLLADLALECIKDEDVQDTGKPWHKYLHGREYIDIARTITDIYYKRHFCEDPAVVRKAEYYLGWARRVKVMCDEAEKRRDPYAYRRRQKEKERARKEREQFREFANVLGAIIE